ncbi:winged helix-turn-helix transcriptional regulator [Streptomyces sp. NPDC051211]|uniref:winged helix-turn-helix transcriptional regulator n=1 Tax=Streptomyces sp. NPDC051211 TaxID=3154643 RepID=UPI00344B5B12
MPDPDRRGDGLARAATAVGDRWSLLLLREIACGRVRFDQLADALPISRKVLADRLRTLTGHRILERRPYRQRPLRHEYLLSPRGRALVPVLEDLHSWGADWLTDHQPGTDTISTS